MKIATKTLASLLLIVMVSVSTINVAGATPQDKLPRTNDRKLERVYKRHDRKLELRASILGISSEQLRVELKKKSFEAVIKQYGFKDKLAFYKALTGKLKEELKKRGWSEGRINRFFERKLQKKTTA